MTFPKVGSSFVVLLLLTSALVVSVTPTLTPSAYAATVSVSTPLGTYGYPPTGSLVGTTVTISGTTGGTETGTCTLGYTPLTPTYTLTIASPTCTLSSGSITATFTIGAGSMYGAYYITVTAAGGSPVSSNPNTLSVKPRIVLNPSSGSAGTTVSVAGSGFTRGSTSPSGLTCQLVGSIVNPITCGQGYNGELAGVFTVRSGWPSGSYLVTAFDANLPSSGETASQVFTIIGGPILALQPFMDTTGKTVTVTGSGFNGVNTQVLLRAETTTPDASSPLWGVPQTIICSLSGTGATKSIASGCTFTVKSNALGKIYRVYGIGDPYGDSGVAEFIVRSSFALTPKTGGRGVTVIISGSGYMASWDCKDDGNLLLTSSPSGLWTSTPSCSVDSNGILTGSFAVASDAALLSYTVTLTDDTLPNPPTHIVQGIVSDTFVVTGPSIWLTARPPGSGATGFTGTTVDVTGSGWSTGDTYVTLYERTTTPDFSTDLWGVPAVFTCPLTPGTGSIASGCKFTVKSNALGKTYNVYAIGTPYNEEAHAQFTVQSTFVLTPNNGALGAFVAISGSGYMMPISDCRSKITSTGPGTLFDSGANPTSCTIDTNGFLTGTFTVEPGPTTPAPYGAYTVKIEDNTLVQQGSISVPFTVTPATLVLSPNHGPTGSSVTFTGSGFSLSDLSCQVFWASSVTPISGSTCSIASGSVSGQFSVPTTSSIVPGGYPVTVRGYPTTTSPDGYTDSATATFTVEPSITLLPTSGRPNTNVLISGSNFAAGDTGSCTISSTPGDIISSPLCNVAGAGSMSGSFTVAASASGGTYTINVRGTTGDEAHATFTVPPAPTLELDPTTGAAGQLVEALGFYYAGTGTCSLTSTPGGLFASSSCALAGGTLTGSFTVAPAASPGTSYTVTATSNLGGTDSASATFTVTAGPVGTLTLAPTFGPLGTPVSGSATGFATDTACILVSSPSGLLSSPSCTIMGAGNINVGFTVASGATPGSYEVLAVGNTGKSASGSFTVTAVTTTTTATTAASFTLTASPTSLTINQGGVGTVSVTVQSVGSFSSPVTLSVPTLPSGVTAGFIPNPVTPPASGSITSVLSLAVSNTAPGSTTIITVLGSGGGLIATVSITLTVPPTTTTTTTTSPTTRTTTTRWCVIATASFGSEVSWAVQLLRNFRDQLVLSTRAGSAFMEVFNAWYYSFSPSVAKVIAGNDPLRAPVRVILYPLLGVLGVSAFTFSLFSGAPEFAIVMAGLVASSLIGLVYLTPFTFLGMRALTKRKRIQASNVAKGSLVLLAVALTLLLAGEIADSFLMLAAASSAVVLICLIAAPTIAALAVLGPKPE